MTIYEKIIRMPIKELAEVLVVKEEGYRYEDLGLGDEDWIPWFETTYRSPDGSSTEDRAEAIQRTIKWLNKDERYL